MTLAQGVEEIQPLDPAKDVPSAPARVDTGLLEEICECSTQTLSKEMVNETCS